jgi:hypothetical protein
MHFIKMAFYFFFMEKPFSAMPPGDDISPAPLKIRIMTPAGS